MSQHQFDTGILPDKCEESTNDVEKRLEGLKLDDKRSDYFKILKRLDQTEPAKETAVEGQPSKSSNNEEVSTDAAQEIVPKECLRENSPLSSPMVSSDPHITHPVIRFRRPVLADDATAGMTDSYEILTLSEVRQIDAQRDADIQLQLEESQLVWGEFDEVDEFEEVDEFDDDWEEGVGVGREWAIEPVGYCCVEDREDEYLDDRN